MKIRLIEAITLRSELLATGTQVDVSDIDARQLIAAGHAEAVTVDPKKPTKTTPDKE